MCGSTIRTYEPGDEEGIASLLRTCFDTFRNYGLDGERWLEYLRINPGMKPEGAYILEEEGRIVSHVQVVEKDLRTPLGVVKVAGIANVSTHPDFRGRGYASTLLRRALKDYKDKGFPLSGLFTGFASGPQRIYRRLGFTDVALDRYHLAPMMDAEKFASSVKYISVSEFVDQNLKAIASIYKDVGAMFSGWPPRSEVEWQEKFVKRLACHSFFCIPRSEGDFMVAKEGDDVVGYVVGMRLPQERETYNILEIVCDRCRVDVLQALYNWIVNRAKDIGCKAIRSILPPHANYERVFKGFASIVGRGVFMIALLNLKDLLGSTVGKRQLAECAPSLRMKLTVGEQEVKLNIKGNEVEVDENIPPDAEVQMPPETFNKLLFGIIDVKEALLDSAVKSLCSLNTIRSALDVLFLTTPLHIWPADHW